MQRWIQSSFGCSSYISLQNDAQTAVYLCSNSLLSSHFQLNLICRLPSLLFFLSRTCFTWRLVVTVQFPQPVQPTRPFLVKMRHNTTKASLGICAASLFRLTALRPPPYPSIRCYPLTWNHDFLWIFSRGEWNQCNVYSSREDFVILPSIPCPFLSLDSSVAIVTGLRAGWPMEIAGGFPTRETVLFPNASDRFWDTPGLLNAYRGAPSAWKRSSDLYVTTNRLLVTKLRINTGIHLFPHTPSQLDS
jgi:hypothetical protein